MTDQNKVQTEEQMAYQKLLDDNKIKIPQVGDTVVGTIISASKAEVKLDVDGVLIGVVRGRELYFEVDEYANLKPGDQIEATVIESENENGELELSFRYAGHEKAWKNLKDAFENRTNIKVKILDANRGGLLVKLGQINGFLPVSQLAPENYPRVSGGDKGKILEKLKSFVGQEFEVKVMTLEEAEEKLVVSEKDAWNEKQKDVISQYKVGSVVEGKITAITDFGVFITFGDNLEGLIHISELAWQRIDDPSDLFKVGDTIKAEVINVDGSKIFLSAKKLMTDPWDNVGDKYKINQIVKGTILKVNPFGLFVKLDDDIHGLAHISQLAIPAGQKINDIYKIDDVVDLEITSIEPKDHRLGLSSAQDASKKSSQKDLEKTDKDASAEKEIKKEKKSKAEKTLQKDSGQVEEKPKVVKAKNTEELEDKKDSKKKKTKKEKE